MLQFPTVWVDNTPDSLLDITLKYCIKHQNLFCKYNGMTEEYDDLLDDLSLPVGICERLLNLSKTEISEDHFNQFITIFKNPSRTHLRHLDLSDSVVNDQSLEVLTRHNIAELNISNCKRLTHRSLQYITKLRNSLVSLIVGRSIQIFSTEEDNNTEFSDERHEDPLMRFFPALYHHNEANNSSYKYEIFPPELQLPLLHKVVINGLRMQHYLGQILKCTEYLTYLDLSNCDLDCFDLDCIPAQKQLTSLILCDVVSVMQCIPAICQLKSLRYRILNYLNFLYISVNIHLFLYGVTFVIITSS